MTNDKTTQPAQADAFIRAVEVRAAQGWKIDGGPVPVLYTDTINDQQVCRDDVWLCKTEHLKSKDEAAPQPEAQPQWRPIETAPSDVIVVVAWFESDGTPNYDFDHKEDDCWQRWHDHAEWVEVVGGHGVSYTPPYEFWMPIPAAPSAQAEQGGK